MTKDIDKTGSNSCSTVGVSQGFRDLLAWSLDPPGTSEPTDEAIRYHGKLRYNKLFQYEYIRTLLEFRPFLRQYMTSHDPLD